MGNTGRTVVDDGVREFAWNPGTLTGKPLALRESVHKWKPCITNQSYPSGTFILPRDPVYATHVALLYLASGADMSFEDAVVLSECNSCISLKFNIALALSVYETSWKKRTTRGVWRGKAWQPFIVYTMSRKNGRAMRR